MMRLGILSPGACLLAACGASSAARAQDWPQFAGTPSRASTSIALPASLAPPRWVASHDRQNNPIAFALQSGVIADRTRVFPIGKVGAQWMVFAIGAADGAVWWAAPIPAPVLDSWSSPALDERNQTVLVATGHFLTAFDAATGTQRWQASLARNVVNASPLIADSPAGRAFITDYDGFGGSSQLYCIDLDPFSTTNPHQPGDTVWSVPIGGSSGNTPACSGGVVFVASVTDESGLSPGQILAFPGAAESAPAPLWTLTNPATLGFFGGVAASGGSVYAASYALSGGQLAGNLVKVDASSGQLLWSAPCNRTDATPVPLPGGLVLLSGGLPGYGSAPSLELFHDNGASASLLWDSAVDTWHDDNGNGVLDPGEFLAIGGWTFQPVVSGGAGSLHALASTPPMGANSFGASTDLYLIDLSHAPHESGFILNHAQGAGATPAAAYGSIYTIGASGLYAFGPAPCYANCDLSTSAPTLNVADFTCFLTKFATGDPYANCDASTTAPTLNVADFTCFLTRFAMGCQ
jgi:outer membrane protein assembly factor BamB